MRGLFIGCIGTAKMVVKVTSLCDLASQCIQGLLEALIFQNKKNQW